MPPLTFASPQWLVAAALLPLAVVGLHAYAESRRRRAWAQYAPGPLRERLVALAPWRRGRRTAAVAMAAGLVGIALARPQIPGGEANVTREGLDLVVALDVSQSMLARDVAPSRLERARADLARLAEALPGDRLGLVLFAADAFVQCPLTTDHAAFRLFLDAASPDMLPTQGTDFEAAMTAAADAFGPPVPPVPDVPQPARVVLVVSDGENHDGSLSRARDIAREAGALVVTVGVGEAEGATIPVVQGGQSVDKVDPVTGEVVRTRLDADVLRTLADDGAYVHVGRFGSGMEEVPTRLSGLTRGILGTTTLGRGRDVFPWPLALALLLLVAESLLPDARAAASSALAGPAAGATSTTRRSSLSAPAEAPKRPATDESPASPDTPARRSRWRRGTRRPAERSAP